VKASVGIAVSVILALIGVAIAAYSYPQLQQEDALFARDSIQLGANSNSTYWIDFLNDNILSVSPRIVGRVGSVGTGVDFYLVKYDNWDSWKTDTEQRSALSLVYLNSDVLSSQSAQGQFSFVAPHAYLYIVVFINEKYPAANNASVHVNISLQDISLPNFCAFIAGLAMLTLTIVLLIVMVRRKEQLSHAKSKNPAVLTRLGVRESSELEKKK
jgi:hypothetical protein